MPGPFFQYGGFLYDIPLQHNKFTCKIAPVPNNVKKIRFQLFCYYLLLACLSGQPAGAEETWLLVDTNKLELLVMQGSRVAHTFEGISIGRYGASRDKVLGDNQTPLGTFRIGWISDESRFHRFMGLTYPGTEAAQRGFEQGLIDAEQWRLIRYALNTGKVPSQSTRLGGLIGIHGIGQGDPAMHGELNWTNGCVAITNEEIDLLSKWVHIGTRVEIR